VHGTPLLQLLPLLSTHLLALESTCSKNVPNGILDHFVICFEAVCDCRDFIIC
jgi:hypothetical protein